MTDSPSSLDASPPSPRVAETPPVTPTQPRHTPECPPAPRLVSRNTARYFIAGDEQELDLLNCSDGDFASIRGTAVNYIRQNGAWHLCRPHDVYDEARQRGLTLSPSSCWTQGPMRLSAAFWNMQRSDSPDGPQNVAMRRDPPQLLVRPPPTFAQAELLPAASIARAISHVRSNVVPAPPPSCTTSTDETATQTTEKKEP